MESVKSHSGNAIWLLPVIRGLVSEIETVRKAFEKTSPAAVAVSVSEEELKALEEYDGNEGEPSNFEEEVYMAQLSRFGEVRKPPPCFLEALALIKQRGIEWHALDLNDVDFTEAYVMNISTYEMMTHSMAANKLRRHRFKADTPGELVLEFDRIVNRRKGFKNLELAREDHMASRLVDLIKRHKTVLALIETERVAGVRQALSRYLPR